VHLLVGYNQGAIADFQKMAAELKRTFPQATDYEIHCGKVQTSRVYKGHSIISWNAYIPAGEYPGWQQFKDANIEYSW